MSHSAEQVALYAYRCLCRELTTRRVSIATSAELLKSPRLGAFAPILGDLLGGFQIGLRGLENHKAPFDAAIQNGTFEEFKWLTFKSRGPWTHQVSGVLYPDFDWLGQPLQPIGAPGVTPQLLTFFTAPTDDGWCITLAWHETSSTVCRLLVRSLAGAVHAGMPLQDGLFRLVARSENQVFRISWWNALTDHKKGAIRDNVREATSLNVPPRSTCLVAGHEGVCTWHFDAVIDKVGA